MLELVKQNIHMNRWKNQVKTQVTLDDDFIVPDTMEDAARLILDSGEICLEPVRTQSGKAFIKGKLEFHVLYCKEGGGLQTLNGAIPFEENVNVPELEERDYVNVSWQLEDLDTEMINSRKLSIRAIVTLEIKAEALQTEEAAIELGEIRSDGNGEPQIQALKEQLEVASIALRRKDTHRIHEVISLPGSKPAIQRVLWSQMRLAGAAARPVDGRIRLDGTLMVFLIYQGEGENGTIQCVEESLPFSGELELQGALEEMIPAIDMKLVHKGIEAKPDYDGEMRELDVDVVIELDIRLYQEKTMEILTDLYATNRELVLEAKEASFDRILAKNTGKCKVSAKMELGEESRVLQICHVTGTVKLDEAEAENGSLCIDGVLEAQVLYLTDDDTCPLRAVREVVPLHYEAEAEGIGPDSIWYLETYVDQLSAVTAGGRGVELRGAVLFDVLALDPVKRQVIYKADTRPLDGERLERMPGIVGYFVQESDSLWEIAKRFHTTVETVRELNELNGEPHPGDCLILIKEVASI